MKKLILCGSALLLSLSFAKAQGVTTTGAYDDFATTDEYADIAWSTSNTQLAITRSAGFMTVTGTNGTDKYPNFGAAFATGIDCETNTMADVWIDIENTSNQFLFMDVRLVDGSTPAVQSSIEPNVSDVTSTTGYGDNTGAPNYYTHRKADNAFALYAGQRRTFRIDLSSVPANIGGLTWTGCVNGSPYTCPQTAHNIDASNIKNVIFNVNYGDGSIDISQGDNNPVKDSLIGPGTVSRFTGSFKIYSLKVGTVTAGTNQAMIENSLNVYPNPAKEMLNVNFNAVSGATIILSDIVGNTVYTGSAMAGENKIAVNTSNLTSGLYLLSISTDKDKVTRKVTIK